MSLICSKTFYIGLCVCTLYFEEIFKMILIHDVSKYSDDKRIPRRRNIGVFCVTI